MQYTGPNQPNMAAWTAWTNPWWRHQMETFSVLLAICVGNSLVTSEFPSQRPVTWSFGVFFDLRFNKRLSKQSWGWWFEIPSHPLWRHCNGSTNTFIRKQQNRHITRRYHLNKFHFLHNITCNTKTICWTNADLLWIGVCVVCKMVVISSQSQCVKLICCIFRYIFWMKLSFVDVSDDWQLESSWSGLTLNSLDPGRCDGHFESIISKYMLQNKFMDPQVKVNIGSGHGLVPLSIWCH